MSPLFIPARNYRPAARGATEIRAIVLHTAECQEIKGVARNVANWFKAQPKAGAKVNAKFLPDPEGKTWYGSSAHYIVDDREVVQCVRESDIAFHCGDAFNKKSIGIELCGTMKQSPEEWRDDFSAKMLELAARLVADLCSGYGLCIERLSAEDLATTEWRGITDHYTVNQAFYKGKGHVDVGPHFPWDDFLARVAAHVDYSATEVPTT